VLLLTEITPTKPRSTISRGFSFGTFAARKVSGRSQPVGSPSRLARFGLSFWQLRLCRAAEAPVGCQGPGLLA
jgi:hypothetical protein